MFQKPSFDSSKYHLKTLLKILLVLFLSAVLGCFFRVETFLFVIGLFIFASFFFLLFYKNLAAGLMFTLAVTLLFQFSGRIAFIGLPDVTPGRVTFLVFAALFLFKLVSGEQKLKRIDIIEWLMVLLYSLCLLSMWQAGTFVRSFGDSVSQFLLPFAYFFIAKNTFDSGKKIVHFFNFAFMLATYASIVAILQHFQIISINTVPKSYNAPSTQDLHYLSGALGLPAATGALVSMCLIVGLYKSQAYFSAWATNSVAKCLAIIPMVIAIFFSYQRSVYAGILGALLILLIFSRNLRRIAAVSLLSVCALVIVNLAHITSSDRSVGGLANPTTVYFRILVARTSLAIFADHPIVGTGFGTYEDYADKYLSSLGDISYTYGEGGGQHNTFLGILSELGSIGMLLFGLIFYFILKKAWGKYKAYPPNSSFRETIVIFFAIVAIYLINANCFEVRYFELINDFFFALAGITVGYTPTDKNSTSEVWIT